MGSDEPRELSALHVVVVTQCRLRKLLRVPVLHAVAAASAHGPDAWQEQITHPAGEGGG